MSVALTEPGLHEEENFTTAIGTGGEDGDPRASSPRGSGTATTRSSSLADPTPSTAQPESSSQA